MKITYLPNTRFASILFILFSGLQLSACSTGEPTDTSSQSIIDSYSTSDSVPTGTAININLDWIAPSEREDNTPLSLSTIGGYNVYYGGSQGDYINTVNINDATAESYTLNDMPSGTYYFVITTYDTDGRESQYSPEIIITI